jgi:hypothetical protein
LIFTVTALTKPRPPAETDNPKHLLARDGGTQIKPSLRTAFQPFLEFQIKRPGPETKKPGALRRPGIEKREV